MLVITIPDKNNFYSLYADGLYASKEYSKNAGITKLSYEDGAVIILYYTYPAYRTACVIRNVKNGGRLFPALSKKVDLLFSVAASRVDKLRRAASFLNEHFAGAYNWHNAFYLRLYFLLQRKGKLDYAGLQSLALHFRNLTGTTHTD